MSNFDYLMITLQWSGFVCLVIGTWFYATRFSLACYYTILGCACLGAWALLLTPIAWGVFAVQFTVGLLSYRNWILRRNAGV